MARIVNKFFKDFFVFNFDSNLSYTKKPEGVMVINSEGENKLIVKAAFQNLQGMDNYLYFIYCNEYIMRPILVGKIKMDDKVNKLENTYGREWITKNNFFKYYLNIAVVVNKQGEEYIFPLVSYKGKKYIWKERFIEYLNNLNKSGDSKKEKIKSIAIEQKNVDINKEERTIININEPDKNNTEKVPTNISEEKTIQIDTESNVEHRNYNEDKIYEVLDLFFMRVYPFGKFRTEYTWWRVENLRDFNVVFRNKYKIQSLMYNSFIIGQYRRYGHLIVGVYKDNFNGYELIIVGMHGNNVKSENPFGYLGKWITVDEENKKYSLTGYWILYVDYETEKFVYIEE
jgi:hypothetical protein